MTLKKEVSNIGFFALIFAAMYAVGKKLDKGWFGILFGRGSDK